MRYTTSMLAAIVATLVAAPICLAQGNCNCTDMLPGGTCDGCVSGDCGMSGCDGCADCGGCGSNDRTARFRARHGRFRVPTLSQVCDSLAGTCDAGSKKCGGLLGGGLGCSRVPANPDCRADAYAWHRGYAHTEYGRPIALVVPPTSHLQTNWSWGTGSSRVSRIDHQFNRFAPGIGGGFGGRFRSTPAWPSDTTQFGVYPVRGLW